MNLADASIVLVLPKLPPNILIGFKKNLGPTSSRESHLSLINPLHRVHYEKQRSGDSGTFI